MPEKKTHIIIIDDNPEEGNALKHALETSGNCIVKVFHPEELELNDLKKANLVLLDYKIENWLEINPDELPISLYPANGVALASMLRAQSNPTNRPVGFAILTGFPEIISAPIAPENRNHLLARMHNIEWVFKKAEGPPDELSNQTNILAKGITQLPDKWPKDSNESYKKLCNLLGLKKKTEIEKNKNSIEECHPPIHEISNASHGLSIIRWMLQRIFPYPTFLINMHFLSARFRVTYESFVKEYNKNSKFKKLFEPCLYKGILSDFNGPRWWKSEIEELAWELTDGQTGDVEKVRSSLKKYSPNLEPTENEFPIVCVDSNFEVLDQFYTVDSAFQIQLDDWPPYASQAWAPLDITDLQSLAIFSERERISAFDNEK